MESIKIKKIYGILGFPLGHSFSPDYFKSIFEKEGISENYSYLKYEVKPEEIQALLHTPELCGLNVTIPYKRKMWPFLSKASKPALSLGAVNVIKREGNEWFGYNTDVIGFDLSLKKMLDGVDIKLARAVIFGCGGAFAAVKYVFDSWSLPYDVVVRDLNSYNAQKAFQCNIYTYSQWIKAGGFASYCVAINTTPVGMYPSISSYLDLPYDTIPKDFFFFDLIYNPEPTYMMKLFAERGATVKGGLEMLHLQADAAWNIWQREEYSKDVCPIV